MKIKALFTKSFKLKQPDTPLGQIPTPGKRLTDQYSQILDIDDTCDETSLASKISEDSITSETEFHESFYQVYNRYTQGNKNTKHNRRFYTLGYWITEPEHVANLPINGKPYPEYEINKELK